MLYSRIRINQKLYKLFKDSFIDSGECKESGEKIKCPVDGPEPPPGMPYFNFILMNGNKEYDWVLKGTNYFIYPPPNLDTLQFYATLGLDKTN